MRNSTINNIPFISERKMREIDRLMVDYYGIDILQMMENTGINLAALIIEKCFSGQKNYSCLAIAGSGNNGGGALACARHLHNKGIDIQVCLTKDFSNENTIASKQLGILKKLNVEIISPIDLQEPGNYNIIIDGMIGYGLIGKPSDQILNIIKWANNSGSKIISLDIPSGIDSSTGEIYSESIKADITVTLALPKRGLNYPKVREYIGELYLADIGVPIELFNKDSINLCVGNIFSKSPIIKIE